MVRLAAAGALGALFQVDSREISLTVREAATSRSLSSSSWQIDYSFQVAPEGMSVALQVTAALSKDTLSREFAAAAVRAGLGDVKFTVLKTSVSLEDASAGTTPAVDAAEPPASLGAESDAAAASSTLVAVLLVVALLVLPGCLMVWRARARLRRSRSKESLRFSAVFPEPEGGAKQGSMVEGAKVPTTSSEQTVKLCVGGASLTHTAGSSKPCDWSECAARRAYDAEGGRGGGLSCAVEGSPVLSGEVAKRPDRPTRFLCAREIGRAHV